MKKDCWFVLALMLALGLAGCSSTPLGNEAANERTPDNQGIHNIAPEGKITEKPGPNEGDSALPVMTADSTPVLVTPIPGDATPPPDQPALSSSDWQTYTSNSLGIAVDYPLDWSVAEDAEAAVFTSPQGAAISLQAVNTVLGNNETRIGNQRCTSRTNPHGLTADVCVSNVSFLYTATFGLQAGDGSTRGFTLLTSTRTAGDVFEEMFDSVRPAQ